MVVIVTANLMELKNWIDLLSHRTNSRAVTSVLKELDEIIISITFVYTNTSLLPKAPASD